MTPFENTSANDQKHQFIYEALRGELPLAELCRKYGISRPTAYKWIERFQSKGVSGLQERSHATKAHANALDPTLEKMILRARGKHPTWGAKKLLAWLQQREGLERICSVSTAHELLKLQGLVRERQRQRRAPVSMQPLGGYEGPNAVWCIDYKGWFKLGNGQRCDALTIMDGYSRYLLRCQAFGGIELENTQRVCEAAFREYGLPDRIRSDNGAPFASVAIGGLSALSVSWIKLGIIPERIEPGRPDQNGRHERMHLTLMEAVDPPGWDQRGQQRNFDRHRCCYNEERPHEALGQQTPQSVYTASIRPYPKRIPEPEYAPGTIARKVQGNGEFNWHGKEVFLTGTLRGETIGLRPVEDGKWEIQFYRMVLGSFDEARWKIMPKEGEKKRRKMKVR